MALNYASPALSTTIEADGATEHDEHHNPAQHVVVPNLELTTTTPAANTLHFNETTIRASRTDSIIGGSSSSGSRALPHHYTCFPGFVLKRNFRLIDKRKGGKKMTVTSTTRGRKNKEGIRIRKEHPSNIFHIHVRGADVISSEDTNIMEVNRSSTSFTHTAKNGLMVST